MKPLYFVTILLCAISKLSAVEITKAIGWKEAIAIEWVPTAGSLYEVRYEGGGVNGTVDNELIRLYPGYNRADILGLKAGNYTVTVIEKDAQGNVIETSSILGIHVGSHSREGFAFADGIVPGAYNKDGTPKDGAKIIYITKDNVNTVTCDVIGEKNNPVKQTGIAAILKARGKGYDKTPLIIRMIGCISKEDISNLKSGNYIDFTGANTGARKIENITIEGVGNDATLKGYGIFTKRSRGIEIRNLGIMLFGDDGISMEADNCNIWVHNCDFFYGSPGGDADQVKGDGAIDMKYNTSFITISFNHFWDSGKTTFAGGANESNPIYFTYSHNWFDHADSRCPRLCHATCHIYNNYFDANPTMNLLSTENTSAFVEANYYRNCPSPMEINMQGTNKQRWPDGEQNGGMNKAYNNRFEGEYTLITQHDDPTDFDAYVVDSRDDKVPETVKSLRGGNTYNNFDTSPLMYIYAPDAPEQVPEIVMGNAGRIEGGDFQWKFDNSVDDESKTVDKALKAALLEYESKLICMQTATGIRPLTSKTTPLGVAYNLNGQVVDLQGIESHGFYIIDGKKISR